MPKDCCRLGACVGLSMSACVRARARACVRSRASRENGDSRTVGPSDVFSACFGSLSALQLRGSTCDRPSPRARRPASTRLDTSRAAPCPEVVPPSKPGPTSSGRVVAPEATLATRTCLRLRRRRLGLVSDLTARQRGVCDVLCRLRRLRLVPEESSAGPVRAVALSCGSGRPPRSQPRPRVVTGQRRSLPRLCEAGLRVGVDAARPGPGADACGPGQWPEVLLRAVPERRSESRRCFRADLGLRARLQPRAGLRAALEALRGGCASGVFWWSGYGSGARSAQGRRLFAISMGPPPGVSKIVGTYINS